MITLFLTDVHTASAELEIQSKKRDLFDGRKDKLC